MADERLIVFTEYKTTLDYLERRLRAQYKDDGSAIRGLYGGMDPIRRREIQRAFNDPDDPVCVLVATDTASEGLDLQETTHLLFYYDIPWNPSRIEQRNGRWIGMVKRATSRYFTCNRSRGGMGFLDHRTVSDVAKASNCAHWRHLLFTPCRETSAY